MLPNFVLSILVLIILILQIELGAKSPKTDTLPTLK
jgi:hypothetical protein